MKNSWPHPFVVIWLFMVLFLACWVFASAFVSAHDRQFPVGNKMHDWFMTLQSGKGPCCSDADGSVIKDADWESKDNHYRVRIENEWYDVPDDAVLKVPNLYGPTMVWINITHYNYKPVRTIRCFMPGTMM
jgi:hypothetical protein